MEGYIYWLLSGGGVCPWDFGCLVMSMRLLSSGGYVHVVLRGGRYVHGGFVWWRLRLIRRLWGFL